MPQGKPKQLCVAPAATPSKPVVIPTRTAPPKARRNTSSLSSEKDGSAITHDPNAVPPSMAALLALTSLQSSRGLAIRRNASRREMANNSFSPEDFRHVLSSSNPKSWNILQSPPEEEELDINHDSEADAWSVTSGSTIAALSTDRSLSYDSMPSLDMELDVESSGSASPPTPATRYKSRPRKGKLQSPKTSVPADAHHPLSPRIEEYDAPLPPPTPSKGSDTSSTKPPTQGNPPTSPFKSNLTASLRRLKSAARTLARPSSKSSGLEPLRPSYDSISTLDVHGLPSLSANIDALPYHLHLASPLPALPPTASIQLMPYVPSTLPTSALATAPPVFLPAANPTTDLMQSQKTSSRPREPRENSDFLRVVVMEMNMRRAGKLDGEGRARIWLGPRRDGDGSKMEEQGDVLAGVMGAVGEGDDGIFKQNGESVLPVPERTTSEASMHGKRERPVPMRWIGVSI